MSFHPLIIATGSFQSAEDPVVKLLLEHEMMVGFEAAKAVADGKPATYHAVIGEIPISETARTFCSAIGICASDPARRTAVPDRVSALAADNHLREDFERCGAADVFDLAIAYAKAGASIVALPG